MLRTQQFSSQVTCSSDSSEGSCGDVDDTENALNDARTGMTFDVESLTVQLDQCQKQVDEIRSGNGACQRGRRPDSSVQRP